MYVQEALKADVEAQRRCWPGPAWGAMHSMIARTIDHAGVLRKLFWMMSLKSVIFYRTTFHLCL